MMLETPTVKGLLINRRSKSGYTLNSTESTILRQYAYTRNEKEASAHTEDSQPNAIPLVLEE